MRHLLTIALAAVLVAGPSTSLSQTTASLSIGFSIPDGVAYQDLDPTPAFGGYVGRGILDNVQAALAFEYSPHSLAATEQNVSEIDGYVLLRYLFPSRDVVRFFLGARAGFARQSADFSSTALSGQTTTSTASSVGFGTGPTVGAAFARGPVVIELSVDGLVYWFGDLSTSAGSAAGSAANGSRFVPRVALAWPFGP